MNRIYKTFRFAYETKYWIDWLIKQCNANLQEEINNGKLDSLGDEIARTYAAAISFNVTNGSIVDAAIKRAKILTTDQWDALAKEAETQKNHIHCTNTMDVTPTLYILQETCDDIENLQSKLRRGSKRGPLKAYIIKLAVYNLYKEMNNEN